MRSFLHQFLELYIVSLPIEGNLESYDVAWWVRSQDEFRKHPGCKLVSRHSMAVSGLFSSIHSGVSRNALFNCVSFTDSISSAIGIKDVLRFAATSERRCSRSFENSVGTLQIG